MSSPLASHAGPDCPGGRPGVRRRRPLAPARGGPQPGAHRDDAPDPVRALQRPLLRRLHRTDAGAGGRLPEVRGQRRQARRRRILRRPRRHHGHGRQHVVRRLRRARGSPRPPPTPSCAGGSGMLAVGGLSSYVLFALGWIVFGIAGWRARHVPGLGRRGVRRRRGPGLQRRPAAVRDPDRAGNGGPGLVDPHSHVLRPGRGTPASLALCCRPSEPSRMVPAPTGPAPVRCRNKPPPFSATRSGPPLLVSLAAVPGRRQFGQQLRLALLAGEARSGSSSPPAARSRTRTGRSPTSAGRSCRPRSRRNTPDHPSSR